MAGSEHRWHSTGQGYRSLAAPSINHQTTQIPLDLTEHFGNWRFGLEDTFNAMRLSVSWWLTCSAGVFFGCANVFARESAMLKLPEERRNGARQRKRGGSGESAGREKRRVYFFSSPPPSFPSFALAPTRRVLPNLTKSKMAATTIRTRTRTRFCPPKIRLHCRPHGHLYSDLWKIDPYFRPEAG